MQQLKQKRLKRAARATLLLGALVLGACEAPLNLTQVEQELARPIKRFDMFQAAAHHGQRVVVVSSTGAVVMSDDSGASWQRTDLPHRPSLIDVTACADGDFYALDSSRQLWHLPATSTQWGAETLDTSESTLSVYCAPNNTVWVSASFATLLSRTDRQAPWREFSLGEDLQFTEIRFVSANEGFAAGEFGTVVTTSDAGKTWEHRAVVPNDFYPMAMDFADSRRGWVGGLDGVVWKTEDGGQSWQRQQTVTTSPVYNIKATPDRVLAVGGSAKLVTFGDGDWNNFEGAPHVLTYLRALDYLPDGSLIVAGGGGTLALIRPSS